MREIHQCRCAGSRATSRYQGSVRTPLDRLAGRVTLKGSGEVVAVKIDPQVVDPSDIETLQDLIVGAMVDASKQVTTMAQEQLGSLTAGLGGPPAPPAPPTQMPGL